MNFGPHFTKFQEMDPGEPLGTSGDPPDPPKPMLACEGEDLVQMM